MRRLVAWIARIALAIVAVITLGVVGLVIVLHTDWGRARVRDRVLASLADVFVGGATIGQIEGSPWSELVVRDLVINGPDRRPVIRVATLRVHLALTSLLSHRAEIDQLIAEDLDLLIERDPSGRLAIEHLTRPGPASRWSVELSQIAIRRGHVRVATGSDPIDLDDLRLDAHAGVPRGGPIDGAAIVAARWRATGDEVRLAGVIHVDHQGIAIPCALAGIGKIGVAAMGVTVPLAGAGYAGSVVVAAPADEVRRLMPAVRLPGDVAVTIEAVPAGGFTQLAVAGTVGHAWLRGFIRADLGTRVASGFVVGSGLDLAQLSRNRLTGTGGAMVAFQVGPGPGGRLPAIDGLATVWGQLEPRRSGAGVIAIGTSGNVVSAAILAASSTGLRTAIAGKIAARDGGLVLDHATMVASIRDPASATGGRAPVTGAFMARITASGALAPTPSLAIAGEIDGRAVGVAGVALSAVHARLDATGLPDRPAGSLRVDASGVAAGATQIAQLQLVAASRSDGKLQVSLRAVKDEPATGGDLDVLVTPGELTIVELQRHRVYASNGEHWAGQGGRIVVGPRAIELTGLRSSSRRGTLAVTGSYIRTGQGAGDLDVRMTAGAELANLTAAYSGRVDAGIDLRRRAGAITGKIDAHAHQFHPSGSPSTFDLDARAELRGGVLVATLAGSSPHSGTAKVEVELDAPHDLSALGRWRRLERSAIRHGEVTLTDIDLAAVAQLAGRAGAVRGKIGGTITIDHGRIEGTAAVRGVHAATVDGAGGLDAALRLSSAASAGDELIASVTGSIERLGRVDGEARFAVPELMFEPTAWGSAGARAFHGASIRTSEIAIAPSTLAPFGIVTSLRGTAQVSATVERGFAGGRLTVEGRQLRGGRMAQSIDARVSAWFDRSSLRATAAVSAGAVTLVTVDARSPIGFDLAHPEIAAVRASSLAATIVMPALPAKSLLDVFGANRLSGGTISGRIDIAGTIARPTATATIVATDVSVPPGLGHKDIQVMSELTITGRWDGELAEVNVAGRERNGGTLALTARLPIAAPDQATGRLVASRLDLAPLAAVLPGPAAGLGGRLDASLTIKGIEPRTADVAGTLSIAGGRIPIAAAVGTLFRADAQVSIADHQVDVRLHGRLGKGEVSLLGTGQLAGLAPTAGKLVLTLSKVQLIGTTEPIVTANVSATVSRDGDRWRAKVDVERAVAVIPEDKGEKLAPIGVPSDVVDATAAPRPAKSPGGTPESRPGEADAIATIEVVVHDTTVESKELRGVIAGKLAVTVAKSRLAVDGTIGLERGDLDLFDRRYAVDRAAVHFDGSTDPVVDVRISHEFPDVTTVTEIRGRVSKPELQLSSQPAMYSQAELLGFLLGGEPSGDPNSAMSARDKVAGTSASVLANQLGGYVKKALPVDIDVLRYESASATSSAAVTIGRWITHTLFLAYKQRIGARADENAGEAEIEYWLHRRLVLEGSAGDRGVDGVDLLWRRRW